MAGAEELSSKGRVEFLGRICSPSRQLWGLG